MLQQEVLSRCAEWHDPVFKIVQSTSHETIWGTYVYTYIILYYTVSSITLATLLQRLRLFVQPSARGFATGNDGEYRSPTCCCWGMWYVVVNVLLPPIMLAVCKRRILCTVDTIHRIFPVHPMTPNRSVL